MADVSPSPFVMRGAREAIAGGMLHIEEQVTGIERAVVENPGLAFDLARTLVESVCRTVLTERAVSFSLADELPRLFKAVTTALPLLPPSASGAVEVRKSLGRTLGGLHGALHGICELRKQCGFASHGPGEPRPTMESVQALLAAEAADAIVGFLYRVHRQDRSAASPRAEYEANPVFNEYVDETHGMIQIFDAEFKPSEVLFEMEPKTYRAYLADLQPEPDGGEPTAATASTPEAVP